MADIKTVSNISGAEQTAINDINENFDEVNQDLDSKVSKSGSAMTGDLDLNNNDLINAKEVRASKIFIGGSQIGNDPSSFVSIPLVFEGDWVTSNTYQANDVVLNDGSSFVCILTHNSSASNEPGVGASEATYWQKLASKGDQGATGAGSGDMLSTNNLSDLDNTGTARTNLGVAIGSDVQAYDTLLNDISGLTLSRGDILFYNGTSITRLPAGTAGQHLQSNGPGADPTWVTPMTSGGIKVWESAPKRLAASLGPTNGSTYMSLPPTIRAATTAGSRMIIKGSIHATGSSVNDRDGLRIELMVNGISIQTLTGWAGNAEQWSGDFAFHYYPGDTVSKTYFVRAKNIQGNTIWTQNMSYYTIEELLA
jgi:hypothetical protein